MARVPHAAQDGYEWVPHKIVNLFKTLEILFFLLTYCNIFNVWPKTTLLPVWPRDAKRLDTPAPLLTAEDPEISDPSSCGLDI